LAKIMSVARFRIHPGKLGEFKALAAQCVRLVRENDPGTTVYDWFINEEGSECIAIDSYNSSEAVLAHIKNVGPSMRELRQLAEVTAELLGSPSQALLDTLQFKSKGIYAYLDGLQ
jgi:quinol monooxygenase YgiN